MKKMDYAKKNFMAKPIGLSRLIYFVINGWLCRGINVLEVKTTRQQSSTKNPKQKPVIFLQKQTISHSLLF